MWFAVQFQVSGSPLAYITAVLVVLATVLCGVWALTGQKVRTEEEVKDDKKCKKVEEFQYFSIGKHRKLHKKISCSSSSTYKKKVPLYKMSCVEFESGFKIIGDEAHSSSCTMSPEPEDLRSPCLSCKGH